MQGVFFAENAQKGFSLLQGKTGEKIASERVTLRDDALLLGGYGTQPFDSEGVSGKNKAVIENGVLKPCFITAGRRKRMAWHPQAMALRWG